MSAEQKNHFLSGPFEAKNAVLDLITVGMTLSDRFKIKKRIKKGRFGTVFLAEDMLNSGQVALKAVDVGPCSEDIAKMQIQREMEAHRKIQNYKHVIKVFDLHFVPWGGTGLLLLSMEFANGGTFREWLLMHQEDWETRQTMGMNYLKQACLGISAVHDANVTHLDLKPENLLISDSILKVSDFGGASCILFLQESSGFYGEKAPLRVGTPLYMSPEQYSAHHPDEIDSRADIYSLGVILFELLHPECHPPFSGSPIRLRELHLTAEAPRMTQAGERMADVIARCLEKKPQYRYQTIKELLDELEGKRTDHSGEAISREKNVANRVLKLWKKASACYSQSDLKNAAKLADQILGLQPDHVQAEQLREDVRERFDRAETFYQEASRNFETGDLSDLTELVKEAASVYPDHPSGHLIQTKLKARVSRYREAMEEGLAALERERWESALNCFRVAQNLHPGEIQLRQVMEDLCQIEEMHQNKNQALSQGNEDTVRQINRSLDLLIKQMKNRIPALQAKQ